MLNDEGDDYGARNKVDKEVAVSISDRNEKPRVGLMSTVNNMSEEVGENEKDCNVAFMVTYSLYHSNENCESFITEGECDNRYLPSYYKDNYFLILPGETVEASVVAYPRQGETIDPLDNNWYIKVNGWNVNEMVIPLTIERV